jgi:adenylate cyclase
MQSSLISLPIGSLTPNHTKAARLALEVYVGLVPGDPEALIALADLLVSDYLNRWNEAENDPTAGKHLLREAEIRADQASAINANLAPLHYAKGLIFRANNQHDLALAEFGAAVGLDPNFDFPHFHAQYSNEYINVGEPANALSEVTRAIQHNHSHISIGVFYWIKGRAYFFMRPPDYDNAILWLEQSVAVRPNLWYSQLYLIGAYALRNRIGDAQQALDTFTNNPEFTSFTPAILESYENDIPSAHPFVAAGLDAFHNGLQIVGFLSP